MSWMVFLCLWLAEGFFWAMFVLWTPITHDTWRGEGYAELCVWFVLAFAVLVTAAASAVAWVFVIADSSGYVLPRPPRSRTRAALRPRPPLAPGTTSAGPQSTGAMRPTGRTI